MKNWGIQLQFEQIRNLKRILSLLKQISRDDVYIYSKRNPEEISFATMNKERTILADMFLKKEETITDESESKKHKTYSLKTGPLFYDIMDMVENGSIVQFDFDDKFNINIFYDDIMMNSSLNFTSEDFIGFPSMKDNIKFKISGEKMAHAFNLLLRLKNDLLVKIENKDLIIESISAQGNTQLKIPASISNKKEFKESIYDYEIIKPLLSASKLSNYIEIMFYWNKKIENNVIIAKCHFKDYNGHIKYLFTPKGVLNELS
jgi:hypothetical protein